MSNNIFRSWIKKLLNSNGARPSRRARSGAAQRQAATKIRPTLEVLEDRVTPSNWLVNNAASSNSGVGNTGTLAYCVSGANADASPADITFNFAVPTVITAASTLQLTNTTEPITIDGTGAGPISISGGSFAQVFDVASGVTANFTSLTVENGSTFGASGAGILNNGTLTLNGVTVSGNSASFASGGGIYNASTGSLTLSNSTVSGNSGFIGGGVSNAGWMLLANSNVTGNTGDLSGGILNEGTLTVSSSGISGNSGGGIFNAHGTVTLSDATLSSNVSPTVFGTGGIYNTGTLTATNSTVSSNQADEGAGIYNYGTMSWNGGSVSNNNATGVGSSGGGGGGVYNSGTLTLSNATVSGNTSATSGGGIENVSGGTATLANDIISGNTAAGGAIDIDNASGATLNSGQNAFTSGTNINNDGTLNLIGDNNTMGALTGSGTITSNLQTYQIDNGNYLISFNDTLYTESEDNWVGNVFTASAGGTLLNSVSFYDSYSTLNGSTLSDPNVTAALYTGAPGAGLTLVPGSENTVPLNASANQWVTVPFAVPQSVAAGQVFTAVVFIPDVPNTVYPFTEDTSGSNADSYFDLDNPPGNIGQFNLAAPNSPTPNGDSYPVYGSSNADVATTWLRVNYASSAATLTVAGGGFFTGTVQDGSSPVGITVGGTSQTLTLTGNDSFSGPTTINAGDTLVAGSTTALSPNSNVNNNGTLNLGGYNNSIGALSGNGAVTNNLVTYQIDDNTIQNEFNNTLITESEDNWVGNVFTAAPGGTQLQSISFYDDFGPLNSSTLPDPNISAALYTGAPGAGLTLVPGSVNTIALNAGPGWITVPFAAMQNIPAGDVFTAALLIDDVPCEFIGGNLQIPPSEFPWTEDTSPTSTGSYFDVDNPYGAVNTYNLASPNDPTLNGAIYGSSGSTNANVGVTIMRVNLFTPAATLTVTGGGSFSGNIQDGSGTVGLTVAGSGQTLTLSGNDTYSGLTTINSSDSLLAGSTTAFSPNSNVSDSGILNMGGFSNSIGALSGNGTVTNNYVLTYQIDNGTPDLGFNNTLYTESEDNWVGNVFTASPAGTQLQSVSFYDYLSTLNSSDLSDPNVTAALYTGAPGAGLTLVPGSENTVALNANPGTWITVPFATPQNVTAGQVFTAALLINDVPNTIYPFTEDTSGSNTDSYFDVDNPMGAVNTYNLAAPNNPTPMGDTYPVFGSTNANVGIALLRVTSATLPATLTVNGGGNFSGDVQDGSGTFGLTVAGSSQTLNLSGNDTYSGQTTVNSTDTLQAGSTTAFSPSSNVLDNGTLDLAGNSNTIGALTGNGVVRNTGGSGATLTVSGGGSFSGTIQDDGPTALTIAGTSQTLTLSGANTYSGQTTVNSTDTLLVDGSETSPVSVQSGGTLGGTGTAGALTVSGTVNPGDPVGSTGTLSASSADFSGGGNLTVQMTNGSNDLLDLSSSLTLGGTSTLTIDLNGLTAPEGPITIVNDGGQTGQFSSFNVINNPNGYNVTVAYTTNTVTVTVAVAVTGPTVATNTADLPANAATLTIDGTGFDPLAGNNTVSFNDGAAGTVTNATTTTLTVSFSTDPITAGSLTAVVTTDSVTSGSPVQVATVIPVVTTNTAGMLQHAPTLTINGFGFDPIASNNTVTFNDGAAGTVTGATATTLTVTFSTAPTAAGSLTAVVTTDSITSGAAVQVATVTSVTSVTVNGDYAPIVDISSNGSGTVTATTDGNNGFTAGNTVVISGYTGANAGYDGTFTVQSASGDQFTVTNTTPSLPTLSSNTAGFAISQNTASALRGVQRSMVDSVVYTFTAPVNLTASNFTLTTSAPSVSGAPASAPAPATLYPGMALTSLGGGSIWVVTWVSGGGTGATVSGHSLADGVYNITLGNSNEGTDTFFRLYGNVVGYNSISHTASLNNQDSLTFTHSYLLSTGATLYLADCDYDANGVINNTDSLNFTHRYLSVWSGFVPTI